MGCMHSIDKPTETLEPKFQELEDKLPLKQVSFADLIKVFKMNATPIGGTLMLTMDNIRYALQAVKIEPSFIRSVGFQELIKRLQVADKVPVLRICLLGLLVGTGKLVDKANTLYDILYSLSLSGEILINELVTVAIALIWLAADSLDHRILNVQERKLLDGRGALSKNGISCFPKFQDTYRMRWKIILRLVSHYRWSKLFTAGGVRQLLYSEPRIQSVKVRRLTSGSLLTCEEGHQLSYKDDTLNFYKEHYSHDVVVQCDLCSKTIETGCWHCRECCYDICRTCKDWISTSKESGRKEIVCHNRHPLRLTSKDNFIFQEETEERHCNSCTAEISGDSLHCRACSFNLCISCGDKLDEAILESDLLKCTLDHSLKWTPDVNKRWASNRFRCDVCRQTTKEEMGSFHCDMCGYDLCLPCAGESLLSKGS
jgi:hypothetical protein